MKKKGQNNSEKSFVTETTKVNDKSACGMALE